MINKNSEVLLIKVENVESSNITPRLHLEHFGSTNTSDDVAIPFDQNVCSNKLLCVKDTFKKFNFSTCILLSMVKRGVN